ncbi:glycosyltransferase family 2 protein [Candidatus Gracilibacteria bacterium 28_42_T64]|nr:glycosyltransferase family 2 protein [Candidatus Gracilibacteria bacterium 28_42_T64]
MADFMPHKPEQTESSKDSRILVSAFTGLIFFGLISHIAVNIDDLLLLTKGSMTSVIAYVAGVGIISAWRYSNYLYNAYRAVTYKFWYKTWEEEVESHDLPLPYDLLEVHVMAYEETPLVFATCFRSLAIDVASTEIPAVIYVSISKDKARASVDLQVIKKTINGLEKENIIVVDNATRKLITINQKGQGKKNALASSIDMGLTNPSMQSIRRAVLLMDCDQFIVKGTIKRSLKFLGSSDRVNAVTPSNRAWCLTDSDAYVELSSVRLGPRRDHSMSVAATVATGRFVIFEGEFITKTLVKKLNHDIYTYDEFGSFIAATGEDKRTYLDLLEKGGDIAFLLSVVVFSIEEPENEEKPIRSFVSQMFRYKGNSHRFHSKVLKLPPELLDFQKRRIFWDQKWAFWTPITGILSALVGLVMWGKVVVEIYFVGAYLIREIQARYYCWFTGVKYSPWMPITIYFDQTFGAFIDLLARFTPNVSKWIQKGVPQGGEIQAVSILNITITFMAVFLLILTIT